MSPPADSRSSLWIALDAAQVCARIRGRIEAEAARGSVFLGGLHSDCFVRDIALPALHAIINSDVASRAERLVVVGGHAERGAQLFVEAPEVRQILNRGW